MIGIPTQAHSERLGALVDILRWDEDHGELVATWLHSYRGVLLSHFKSIELMQIAPDTFNIGFRLLDEDLQTRVLCDPDVARRLLGRLASSSPRDTPGIAAVLLTYLSQTDADRGVEVLCTWKHTTDNDTAVKTITEFDTASNFVFPWITTDVTALCPVSNRDLPIVREKVDQALRCLGNVCSLPRSFFGAFTFRFAVRSEPGRPHSFSSCSFGKYPGLTLLINAQQERIDIPMLIDALVHEAIHAAIYIIESLGEPLLWEPFPPEVKVQSPWSGNALYIDQFAQACFVWWGLANLWQRFSSADEAIATRANELLRVALAGFARDPINCLLTGEAKGWITQEGQAALLKVREMMTAMI